MSYYFISCSFFLFFSWLTLTSHCAEMQRNSNALACVLLVSACAEDWCLYSWKTLSLFCFHNFFWRRRPAGRPSIFSRAACGRVMAHLTKTTKQKLLRKGRKSCYIRCNSTQCLICFYLKPILMGFVDGSTMLSTNLSPQVSFWKKIYPLSSFSNLTCIYNGSIFTVYFSSFWNWIVKYVPRECAPNVLTLAGFLSAIQVRKYLSLSGFELVAYKK
jgi:hypothetical protein